jgi:hypothetical protein
MKNYIKLLYYYYYSPFRVQGREKLGKIGEAIPVTGRGGP